MPTAITRYVNTASSGGNGTTNNTSGATAAYASLNAWHTAEVKNLVSADETHTVICTGGEDTTSVQIDLTGWTTDATRTLTIRSDDSFTASYASGYRIKVSSGTNNILLCANLTLTRIRAMLSTTSGSQSLLVNDGAARTGILLDSCWLRFDTTLTTGVKNCLQNGTTSDGSSVTLKNCILDCLSSGSGNYRGFGQTFSAGSTWTITNCTITGFRGSAGAGIDSENSDGATWSVKNTLVFNNFDDLGTTTGIPTTTYSCGDDSDFTSGTGNFDFSPSGTEADDWVAALPDYGTHDYTPVAGASVVGTGVGPGADGSIPTVDMFGNARSGSTTDIGAIMAAVSASSTILVRPLAQRSYRKIGRRL